MIMTGYIYQIYCSKNGKSYIGQTVNFTIRQNRHLRELRKNIHCNLALQNAFNKYGEDCFYWKKWQFDNITQDDLNELEKEYIKKYDSFCNGFNMTEGGELPPNHQILSDEVLSYCLCILNYYEWCGHALEEYFGVNQNMMAPLKRGETAPHAWELYNQYSDEQKKQYAKYYYEKWGIATIRNQRLARKCGTGSKIFEMTQNEYNQAYAAQELGYGYSCVAKYFQINPATVKDWYSRRARKKNYDIYMSLSSEQKEAIKSQLPILKFQKLENERERLLRQRKESAEVKSRN